MNEHPRIGDRAVRGGMSAAEQSGAAAASDEVRQGLADGNLAYDSASAISS
jgi:OHCU decarboxylase.